MVNAAEFFGVKAGAVWQCLHEHGQQSVVQIKHKTKLSNPETYGGLGWLAREDKLLIQNGSSTLFKFSLK